MNKKFFIVMSVLALFAVAGIFAEESVKNPATETQVEQQAPQDNAKAIKYIAATAIYITWKYFISKSTNMFKIIYAMFNKTDKEIA